MRSLKHEFTSIGECRGLRLGLWQCPPFLIIVIGTATIVSMLGTYLFASRLVEEPEIAALIVIAVTILFLIIGHFIIAGFAKAAEANRAKAEFISIVSHQLRSPLSVFKWTIGVLQREEQRLKPNAAIRQSLQALAGNAEEMIKLVNTLLEVSRIEARRFILRQEEFSLVALTKHVVSELENFAGASGISFSLTASGELPRLTADRERIAIVVTNLITNAIQYTIGPATIAIAIAKQDGALIWSVADKGMSIPKEQQRSVFQKFFRAENAKVRQTHGSGIGLYVSKAIIEASGGRIGFRSTQGRGTTFWFTMPLSNKK